MPARSLHVPLMAARAMRAHRKPGNWNGQPIHVLKSITSLNVTIATYLINGRTWVRFPQVTIPPGPAPVPPRANVGGPGPLNGQRKTP
nr:hypothetical protein Iba_chr04bCG15730 [Ipomoea batatas]